ncbi:hypothetical protein OS493_006854 [Desmophyllum pertusum]|uniref:Uncharacterized protein n=1 Tax=Desmophyllum pertusum TaxID=174260 RepID=A0A9W9ZTG3_9CNID|nr:hypothetical protein OS493_006854 [Desmophyllum pertusum]
MNRRTAGVQLLYFWSDNIQDVTSQSSQSITVIKSIPDIAPRKMNGYQPSNCGQPESESTGLSKREAYGVSLVDYTQDDPSQFLEVFRTLLQGREMVTSLVTAISKK